MSYQLTQDCIDMEAEGVTSSMQCALIVLCRHAEEDGGDCYPSLECIARKTHMNIKTVRKAISDLEQKGWITITRNRRGAMRYLINVRKIRAIKEAKNETTKIGSHSCNKARIVEVTKNGLSRVPKQVGVTVPILVAKENREKNNKKNNVNAHVEHKCEISFSALNRTLLHKWTMELLSIPEARGAIESYCQEIARPINSFVSHLYADERAFNIVKPWLQELRLEGRI